MNDRTRVIFCIIMVVLIIIIIGVLLYGIQHKKYDIAEVLYITKSINVEESEQRSRYNQMMIRILTVHSFRYDNKYKRCMSKEQKIEYIRFNYKCALLLSFGLYDIPILHLMESNFNPFVDHDYGETGIGGIKYGTALFAYALINFLPNKYRHVLRFELKSRKDLYDPITSTKIAYILLWWERRQFKGREDWYISIYHWGGFLAKRWDKGKGNVPEKFTLNGKPYNVFRYYLTFKEFKTAFESGMLEASIPIEKKWRDHVKKMRKEEIDFRRTKNIIRKLRKQLREKKDIEKRHDEKVKDIEKTANDFYKIVKDIGGIANKKGWKNTWGMFKRKIKDYFRKEKKK